MHVPGLGPKTARKLWTELGVADLDSPARRGGAAEAARPRRPRRQDGGEGAEVAGRASEGAAATGRTLLGKALPGVRRAVEEIEASGLADRVSEAGSVRRRAETTKDIDLIATATDPAALTSFFSEREWVAEVVPRRKLKATVVSHEGFRFDLVVPPKAASSSTSPAREGQQRRPA